MTDPRDEGLSDPVPDDDEFDDDEVSNPESSDKAEEAKP